MNSRDNLNFPRSMMVDPIKDILVDVQGSVDTRHIAINRVGIKAIRHPIRVATRAGAAMPTIATFAMYVSLPEDKKGTHMSRFIEILNADMGQTSAAMTIGGFREMLQHMVKRLEASTGLVEMRFPFFIEKAAPVSGVKSLMDYEVMLRGEIVNGVTTVQLQVLVPVTSLCPCSKQISEYGAHNQRSHVTVTATLGDDMLVEELVELVEAEASCELYGLLKRPDEKYVTERAYDNPKFVEDMVRDVAARLNAESRITAYTVESENFESIHNHSAYALIERVK